MSKRPSIILAAPPESADSAQKHNTHVAYMTYRIGDGFRLYRTNMPALYNGGIMVVDDVGFSGSGSYESLSGEIIRECISRRFSGIMLNIEPPYSPLMLSLAEYLSYAASRNDLTLYVPETVGNVSESARIMINTCVTSGNLASRIERAARLYDTSRLVFDIELTRKDFVLPANSECCRELSKEDLIALIRRTRAHYFFSRDLCANYFTYRENRNTHFVIFDNSESIRQKISIAERLGIDSVFLYYPHVEGFINRLLR